MLDTHRKFKKIYYKLGQRFNILIINSLPQTYKTQKIIK